MFGALLNFVNLSSQVLCVDPKATLETGGRKPPPMKTCFSATPSSLADSNRLARRNDKMPEVSAVTSKSPVNLAHPAGLTIGTRDTSSSNEKLAILSFCHFVGRGRSLIEGLTKGPLVRFDQAGSAVPPRAFDRPTRPHHHQRRGAVCNMTFMLLVGSEPALSDEDDQKHVVTLRDDRFGRRSCF